MNVKEKYREQIASFLGIESKQVHVYWKGRVGLYAILKAMGIGPGDEVVLPAFTVSLCRMPLNIWVKCQFT